MRLIFFFHAEGVFARGLAASVLRRRNRQPVAGTACSYKTAISTVRVLNRETAYPAS